jgi:hypothetical protein
MARDIVIRGMYVDEISPGIRKSSEEIRSSTSKSKKEVDLLSASFEKLKEETGKFGKGLKDAVGEGLLGPIKALHKGITGGISGILVMFVKLAVASAVVSVAMKGVALAAKNFGGILLALNSGAGKNPLIKFLADATRGVYIWGIQILKAIPLTSKWAEEFDKTTKKTMMNKIGLGEAWDKYLAKMRGPAEAFASMKKGFSDLGSGASGASSFFKGANEGMDKLKGLALSGQNAYKGFITAIKGIGLAAAGIMVAVIATKKLIEMVGEFSRLGNEIYQNAQKVNFSTAAYQAWDIALRGVGSSIEETIPAINKLQKTAVNAANGTDAASIAFKSLGISAKESNGAYKTSEKLFEETTKKLAAMQDVTRRNAIAQDIFGESASKLYPILSKGAEGLTNYIDASRKNIAMSDKAIAGAVTYTRAMDTVGNSFKKMGSSLVEGLIPRIGSIAESLKESGILDMLEKVSVAVGKLISGSFLPLQKLLEAISAGYAAMAMDVSAAAFVLVKSFSAIMSALPNWIVSKQQKDYFKSIAQTFSDELDASVVAYEKSVARVQRINPTLAKLESPSAPVPDSLVPGTATTTSKTVERERANNVAIESIQIDRLGILDKYAQISINNIVNEYDRRRALVIYNLDKENYELEKSYLANEMTQEDYARASVEIAKAAGFEYVKVSKDQAAARLETEKKLIDAINEIRYAHIALSQNEAVAGFTKERDQLKAWYDEQIKMFADNKAMQDEIDALYAEKSKAIANEVFQYKAAKVAEAFDAMSTSVNAIAGTEQQYAAYKNQQIDQEQQKKIDNAKANIRNKRDLEKELASIDKEAEAKRRKLAKAEMGMNIATAIANVAQGVTKAIAQGGVLGLITGGVVAAAGAVSVGFMLAQMSKMEKGGVVKGDAATGDSQPTMLTPGEVVMNRTQQANTLMAIANGQSSGSRPTTITGGATQVIIQGNADEAVVNKALKVNRQKQMEDMKQLLKDMQYNGSIRLQVA